MRTLASDTGDLATAADAVQDIADKRANRTRDVLMAALVRHVHSTTGRYRDADVSLIIGAAGEIVAYYMRNSERDDKTTSRRDDPHPSIPERGEYDSVALAQWRARHQKLLKQETEFEVWWRERAKRPPDAGESIERS